MSRFDELIRKYATELRDKCGIEPDMALLERVTKGCGPSIYNNDAATVSSTDDAELERVKRNFLIGKLKLPDHPGLEMAIQDVVDRYGRSNRNKYRAVFYYLLVIQLKREAAYS